MKLTPAWALGMLLLGLGASAQDRPAATEVAMAAAAATADGRPQMAAAEAARHQLTDYLSDPRAAAGSAGAGPWQPPSLAALQASAPDFIVAADGSGSHRTVQAAVDAAPARGVTSRPTVILIRPGVYREALCVRDKAPLRLLGSALDPAAVRLVEGRYHAQPKAVGAAPHPCLPASDAPTHGTAGSTSVAIHSDDVVLAHLSVVNDAMDGVRAGQGYPPGAGESGGAQAVALTTAGDRILLDQVRLLGHQDTLYARRRETSAPGAPARVLVRHSLIAGDVDFIFGDATLVIQHSLLLSRAGRRLPGHGGHVLAPSTAAGQAHGFLVTHSRWLAEPGVAPASVSLGRAWDHGVPHGQWQAGVSPNGQALVRDCELGPHLAPWARSTSRRPASADGPLAHRLREFHNVQVPSR